MPSTESWPVTGSVNRGNPNVADLDLDGFKEVICGNRAWNADGTPFWAADGVPGIWEYNSDLKVAIGNITDHDGLEVVVCDYDHIYLVSSIGEIISMVNILDRSVNQHAVLANLDDDELRLNGYFLADIINKSIEQRVYVDLYLPEGQVIYLDNSTRTFLYDIDNTQNIYVPKIIFYYNAPQKKI